MFHVFVTFEVVMYFSELSLRHKDCKSRVYCHSCFNITNTEKMGREREILQPAGQGGRPPLALTRGLLVCVLKKKHV